MRTCAAYLQKTFIAVASAGFLASPGISHSADVLPLFQQDPDSIVIVSKSPGVRGNQFLYLREEGEPYLTDSALLADIENHHLYTPVGSRKQDILQYMDNGARALVRGKDEYVKLFGNAPQDWPLIMVVRSRAATLPAPEPVHAVTVDEFEASRDAYVESGPHCTPGQSRKEPPLPATMAELSRVRAAAIEGDPDAQWVMGTLYFDGERFRRDIKEAVAWYEKSAAQCNMHAQNSLGMFHYYGNGYPPHAGTAQSYFLKSAAQGNELAKLNLGVMYVKGGAGLAGASLVGQGWLSAAYRGDNPFVRQRAYETLVALDQQAARARQAGRGQADSARGENCDMQVGFSCNAGIDLLGASIYMGTK